MGWKRVHFTVDIRDDVDDNGLLDFVEQEVSEFLDDLLEADPLVIDCGVWREEGE